MNEPTNFELLEQLDSLPELKKEDNDTGIDIVAGFEEIRRFVCLHGRLPLLESESFFERRYALRLDSLRSLSGAREILDEYDKEGILGESPNLPNVSDLDDTALLSELGASPDRDITRLTHVRPSSEKQAADKVADRIPCEDFDLFKPLFEQVKMDLDSGSRETRPFGKDAQIKLGDYFIIGGQIAYVADEGIVKSGVKGDVKRTSRKHKKRPRIIYDNGMESDILLHSLSRALYKDEGGRRITDSSAGPLFGSEVWSDDTETGTIYVLRSFSSRPDITEYRELIHKIGVTGGSVEGRLSGASQDVTFLFADVEVVAEYELYNINRSKLENLLHRFFSPARLDIEIHDRFGKPVKPREWFLVPLPAINQAIEYIKDRSIVSYRYDVVSASIVKE